MGIARKFGFGRRDSGDDVSHQSSAVPATISDEPVAEQSLLEIDEVSHRMRTQLAEEVGKPHSATTAQLEPVFRPLHDVPGRIEQALQAEPLHNQVFNDQTERQPVDAPEIDVSALYDEIVDSFERDGDIHGVPGEKELTGEQASNADPGMSIIGDGVAQSAGVPDEVLDAEFDAWNAELGESSNGTQAAEAKDVAWEEPAADEDLEQADASMFEAANLVLERVERESQQQLDVPEQETPVADDAVLLEPTSVAADGQSLPIISAFKPERKISPANPLEDPVAAGILINEQADLQIAQGDADLLDDEVIQRMEMDGELVWADSLVLRHVFPPVLPQRSLSFLGGAPVALEGFDWPRAQSSGLPMHFLGQMDCASLPEFAQRGLFPADGAIYFFRSADGIEHQVKYQADTGSEWLQFATPTDLPALSTGNAYLSHAQGAGDLTYWNLYPRVEIEFLRMRELDDGCEYSTRRRARLAERLARNVSEHHVERPRRSTDDWHVPAAGELAAPYAGFPRTWLGVEMTAGRIALACGEIIQRFTKSTIAQGIADDCQSAMMQARQMGAMSAVSEEDRAEFWTGMGDVARRACALQWDGEELLSAGTIQSQCVQYAAIRSAEAGLAHSPETAELFSDLVEDLAARHWMEKTGRHVTGLAASDGGDAVLLAQFAPNVAMGWAAADGTPLQFWIDRDDLAQGRFDRATVKN